jgi:4-amino-4-deoxy-L-arabinose transferase-like glycosyltransferase
MSDEAAVHPPKGTDALCPMSFNAPLRWLPLLFSALFPLALLIPFADKAYHIDDPLYLWSAKQIHAAPFDYYGAVVNKWGKDQPLSELMVLPPGHPYFLALVALMFGWGEVPLHLAMALTASLLGSGTYLVACRLCARPGLAAVLTILAPAFMVSSTTVMTDIPMTAFFVWGVFLWLAGLEKDRHGLLFASSVCMSLSLLFKYSGFTVVPLLLAYSILAKRRAGVWALHLLVPVLVLAGYQYIENVLYGKAQLIYSFQYVQSDYGKALVPDWLQPVIGVTFVGGCLASISLLAPLLWPWRVLLGAIAAVAGLTYVTYAASHTLLYTTRVSDALTLWLSVQNAFWFVLGLLVLMIGVLDLWRVRDKNSVLLFLWVFGSFAFATQVNWSVNARALLPMLPPLAILAARRLDLRGQAAWSGRRRWICAGLVAAGAALSLTLTVADYKQANIARAAARKFIEDDKKYPYQYYFEDHWGFQYYMEEGGIPYLDTSRLQLHDRIVAPLWGSVDPSYNPALARRVPSVELKQYGLKWVTTMHPSLCAGFYAHTRGPLPFAFGPVPPEEYAVFQAEYYDRR